MFSFQEAIDALNQGASILRVAREARPSGNYRFADILPEIARPSYRARGAAMRIRTTMAGMAAMSSPYAPTGAQSGTSFDEATIKLANEVPLDEETLREIQTMVSLAQLNGGATLPVIIENVLNFTDKVLVQAHLDTTEWLRGQALLTGGINWTFEGITVVVDYNIPSDNILAQRTGNDAYGGSSSKFWDDIRALKRVLRYNVAAFYAHPDTIDEIVNNSVNNLQIIAQNEITGEVTLRKLVTILGQPAVSEDARDVVRLIPHGDSGEVYDMTTAGASLTTKDVPFCPRGVILAVGRARRNQWQVSAGSVVGSTPEPTPVQLGYTHIAPTVEAQSLVPGRWANVYVPEGKRWQIVGQAASNVMPVIEDPYRIAVASTEMS